MLLLVHVLLSLIAIPFGFLVVDALIAGRRPVAHVHAFLWTMVATNVSGFLLPADRLLPSHVTGIISMAALLVAFFAFHAKHLAGGWAGTFAICAVAALYLDVFVGIVQTFQKVPPIHDLAPTQSEPPFAVVQGLILLGFIALGRKGYKAAMR